MFVEKLNKKEDGFYIIEEEKTIVDGKWEGFLDHDNVNRESIVIYTEPNFTGEKVDNFFISIPSETPWKTYLKVFSHSEKIYIIYESKGDQVAAEDINLVQEKISELEEKKAEKAYVDETFATKEEVSNLEFGDMNKSVYDKNNNGKVDIAENAEKLGGKPPDKFMKAAPVTWNDLKGV